MTRTLDASLSSAERRVSKGGARAAFDKLRQAPSGVGMLTERLFSYGTLQLESVQRAQFGRVLEGVSDALVGYGAEMVEITDPDVLAKSGERFHPIVKRTGVASDRVTGTVFAVTREELAAADEYEVEDYARIEALLASGLRAWVYVARSLS